MATHLTWKGYLNSVDITKIPDGYLTTPSKNVITRNGTIYTRLGLALFGAQGTTNIFGTESYTWEDAIGGERALRVWEDAVGTSLEVYYNNAWRQIYTLLDRWEVSFATWTDNSVTTAPVSKKRLFMADGTVNLAMWNGAIGVVQSTTPTSITITPTNGSASLLGHGWEPANATPEIVRTTGGITVSRTDAGNSMTMAVASSVGINPGDIIYSVPVQHTGISGGTNIVAGTKKDVVATFETYNHLAFGTYGSIFVYFSSILGYTYANGLNFDYTVVQTATTPFLMQLDGPFTAFINRRAEFWISTVDSWWKITKNLSSTTYFNIFEKVNAPTRQGALPRACASLKNDSIFFSQMKRLERITSLDVIQQNKIELMSNEIETLLTGLNVTDLRLYYIDRYIYIIAPSDGLIIMYDNIEGAWQPPQEIAISSISYVGGVQIAHSSSRNESYELFKGLTDNGFFYNAIVAPGYIPAQGLFTTDHFTKFGISGRLRTSTNIHVDYEFETDGATNIQQVDIPGDSIKVFNTVVDDTLGAHPLGDRSLGGGDLEDSALLRFFAFDKVQANAFFEWRPIITISRTTLDETVGIEAVVLGFYTDSAPSGRTVPNDLFISK
jgi:hypothetical protein